MRIVVVVAAAVVVVRDTAMRLERRWVARDVRSIH
jgi:hypothetical protein